MKLIGTNVCVRIPLGPNTPADRLVAYLAFLTGVLRTSIWSGHQNVSRLVHFSTEAVLHHDLPPSRRRCIHHIAHRMTVPRPHLLVLRAPQCSAMPFLVNELRLCPVSAGSRRTSSTAEDVLL